jgi:hypothetical protein
MDCRGHSVASRLPETGDNRRFTGVVDPVALADGITDDMLYQHPPDDA